MTTTYRAAILFTADRQGSTVLTGPEHAHLSDDQLHAEAQREIDRAGIRDQIDGQTVEISPRRSAASRSAASRSSLCAFLPRRDPLYR